MSRLKVMGFDWQQQGIRVGTGLLGFFWLLVVCMRLDAPKSDPAITSNMALGVLGLALGLAVWQSLVLGRSWAVAARVLRARQVPVALWQQWLRVSLTASYRVWAFLGVVAVGAMGSTKSPWHSFAAAALMAIVVCLAGPGLLAWLWQRWSGGPPAGTAVAKGLVLSPFVQRIQAWATRYTVLEGMSRDFMGRTVRPRGALLRVMFLPAIFCLNGSIFGQALGSSVTALQIWMTGLFVLLVCGNLVCKDTHWRLLLAPGGVRQGRLGWHIAVSTATIYAVGAAVMVTLGLGVAWFASDHGFQGSLLSRFVSLPFVLAFAIAFATLMRGTRYPLRWFSAALALWLLAGAGIHFALDSSFQVMAKTPAATVNLPYLLTFLVLAAPALWASNKLWTVERLMQCAPKL